VRVFSFACSRLEAPATAGRRPVRPSRKGFRLYVQWERLAAKGNIAWRVAGDGRRRAGVPGPGPWEGPESLLPLPSSVDSAPGGHLHFSDRYKTASYWLALFRLPSPVSVCWSAVLGVTVSLAGCSVSTEIPTSRQASTAVRREVSSPSLESSTVACH